MLQQEFCGPEIGVPEYCVSVTVPDLLIAKEGCCDGGHGMHEWCV